MLSQMCYRWHLEHTIWIDSKITRLNCADMQTWEQYTKREGKKTLNWLNSEMRFLSIILFIHIYIEERNTTMEITFNYILVQMFAHDYEDRFQSKNAQLVYVKIFIVLLFIFILLMVESKNTGHEAGTQEIGHSEKMNSNHFRLIQIFSSNFQCLS